MNEVDFVTKLEGCHVRVENFWNFKFFCGYLVLGV